MSEHTNDTAIPSYRRPELLAVTADLELMSDLLAGTRRMWEKASLYIRKWADEEDAVYLIRSKCEQVFEGVGRTLSAAVGMLFAREPGIEWNAGEVEMREHWKNIDGAGTKGHVFVKRFSETSMRDGVGLIFVDNAPRPIDPETKKPIVVTADNEVELGLRPTWSAYPRQNILSWRTDKVNNQHQFTQVVLWEPTQINTGLFGVETVNRYRVLQLVEGQATWVLWERKDGKASQPDIFVILLAGIFKNSKGQAATKLPVTVAHTGRMDKMLVASVPLMGVAWANLGHWQQASNLRFYRDLAAFPQPTIIGELVSAAVPEGLPAPAKVKLGPLVTVHLKGEGASFGYTAPPSEGFAPVKEGVEEKLQAMAVLGMSFLASDTSRQRETAEAKRLDATAENATLATAAQGIDDAINGAYKIHAWYLGIAEEEAPVFTLNRDFESTAMDPQTMQAYVQAVKDAGLPPRLLLEAWQKGGRIPPDTDLDELEAEMFANQAAIEEDAGLDLDAA